jgi:cell wall-associated protease
MRLSLAIAVACLVSTYAVGANIAVIDSGVDYKHVDLKNNIWQNPASPQNLTTADGKTYQNVINGWNFAENNNQIIDYKYLGTFSQDCYKIFEVQAKILQGTATQADKDWYAQKKADQTFLKELQKFGNFVHGTHVSGISANNAKDAEIAGLKLIPTAPPGTREIAEFKAAHPRAADNPMAKMFLQMMAKRQAELLITTGNFTAATGATVANGSFGTSVAAVKPAIEGLLQQLLGKAPTEQEKEDYAKFFVAEIATASKGFVSASAKTLFVFAAGNDGSDNDVMPVSPANIKADNSIAVAATNGTASLATFSNYGATMVEVAAPGVAILSTIPGDKTLQMSGTSMAAPFVTNVAGLVVDENGALTPAAVKKILMETVDKKAFLQGKVSTGGIVNKSRALMAARLSRSMDLASAISEARARVSDEAEVGVLARRSESDLLVLPLPMF